MPPVSATWTLARCLLACTRQRVAFDDEEAASVGIASQCMVDVYSSTQVPWYEYVAIVDGENLLAPLVLAFVEGCRPGTSNSVGAADSRKLARGASKTPLFLLC
jgi:hypothetical protein